MNREGGNPSACSSCKHQRKKCDQNCELAPYFPASRYHEFQNAHKLFGVSNILKIMNAVEPSQRQATAESILMEGNARRSDPVNGCLGIISNLKSQVEFYEKQLNIVNQHLAIYRGREKLERQNQKLEDSANISSFASKPPLASTPVQHNQIDEFKLLSPILPNLSSEYIGDKKNSDDGYNYPSTLEEGTDVKPFDIQPIDQMLEDYQHENFITNFNVPGESRYSASFKTHGKRPMEYVGEEYTNDIVRFSAKGKEDQEDE